MISKEHKKHTDLARPSLGRFGRLEWAILGSHCNTVKTLAGQVFQALNHVHCAYVDTQHADEHTSAPTQHPENIYTWHPHHHDFQFHRPLSDLQRRSFFNECGLVLVNGNHFEASRQIVIIDSAKKASLLKRRPQLTHVDLVLLAEGEETVFDFLQELVQNVPVYRINETEKIIAFFEEQLQRAKAILHGLVLAGGQSLRMGRDKALMEWHGMPQHLYAAGLLEEHCREVFISQRQDQSKTTGHYPVLTDTFTGLGPYGALLSAFRAKPDAAWLVLACDMPLIDRHHLLQLVKERDTSAVATAFTNPANDLPEPLAAIWEPKSYAVLLSLLAQGISCPRKALLNSRAHLIEPAQASVLMNVNTPEDAEQLRNAGQK